MNKSDLIQKSKNDLNWFWLVHFPIQRILNNFLACFWDLSQDKGTTSVKQK